MWDIMHQWTILATHFVDYTWLSTSQATHNAYWCELSTLVWNQLPYNCSIIRVAHTPYKRHVNTSANNQWIPIYLAEWSILLVVPPSNCIENATMRLLDRLMHSFRHISTWITYCSQQCYSHSEINQIKFLFCFDHKQIVSVCLKYCSPNWSQKVLNRYYKTVQEKKISFQ